MRQTETQLQEAVDMPTSTNPLVTNLGLIVATFSILLTLWKIASFLQAINHQMIDLHKDLCKLSKEQLKIHTKYENIYFFLIRQHGLETVQKHFRHEEREEEHE
jgi:hypothetical protein